MSDAMRVVRLNMSDGVPRVGGHVLYASLQAEDWCHGREVLCTLDCYSGQKGIDSTQSSLKWRYRPCGGFFRWQRCPFRSLHSQS